MVSRRKTVVSNWALKILKNLFTLGCDTCKNRLKKVCRTNKTLGRSNMRSYQVKKMKILHQFVIYISVYC